MKKRALTASTMFAVPTFAADYSGEDPQLEKNIKILTIWAEDNDNGMLLNKICEDYQKNVNPNFTWEYEMVASQCHLDKDCFIVRNSYTADKHFVYLLYFYLITLLT